jgi:hypothetical protein
MAFKLRWAIVVVALFTVASAGLSAQAGQGSSVPDWIKNNWWAILILVFHFGGTYQEFRYLKIEIKGLKDELNKFQDWKEEFLKELPEDYLSRREAKERLSNIERKQTSMNSKMDAMNNRILYLSGGRER